MTRTDPYSKIQIQRDAIREQLIDYPHEERKLLLNCRIVFGSPKDKGL